MKRHSSNKDQSSKNSSFSWSAAVHTAEPHKRSTDAVAAPAAARLGKTAAATVETPGAVSAGVAAAAVVDATIEGESDADVDTVSSAKRLIALKGVQLVLPGQQIHVEDGCMRGHGTYLRDGKIYAAICGVTERVNKLVYVKPLRRRYEGSVGDVVVGRVVDISNGKWLIDINAAQTAALALAATALPEQRRRLDEDLLEMQKIFTFNDLLCCEVQRVREDGQVLLHTRSSRYGLLLNGVFIAVSSQQIKRQSHHIVVLSYGVQVVLGVNGYVWISLPVKKSARDSLNFALNKATYESVSAEQRMAISRTRNVVLCLSKSSLDISAAAIEKLYFSSIECGYHPKELTDTTIAQTLVEKLLTQRLEER